MLFFSRSMQEQVRFRREQNDAARRKNELAMLLVDSRCIVGTGSAEQLIFC